MIRFRTRFNGKWIAVFMTFNLAATGCVHVHDWKDGVPPSGAQLTDDQRVHEYSRFAVARIDAQTVVIHEKSDDIVYDLKTFRPIMDNLDPSIYQDVQSVYWPSYGNIIVHGVAAGAIARGSISPNGSRKQVASYIGAGVLVLSGYLIDKYMKSKLEHALESYLTKLDKRLFPN